MLEKPLHDRSREALKDSTWSHVVRGSALCCPALCCIALCCPVVLYVVLLSLHDCTRSAIMLFRCLWFQLMPLEEQNAPGFYYLVRWRRRDLSSSKDYEEQTVDASTNNLTVIGQPIYKAYEIFVLAINEIGEAASKPRLVIGHSSEAGTHVHHHNYVILHYRIK